MHVVATAGHVDHGKSTLVGRLLRLTAFEQGGDMRQPRMLGLDLVPAREVVAQRAQFLHRQRQALARPVAVVGERLIAEQITTLGMPAFFTACSASPLVRR